MRNAKLLLVTVIVVVASQAGAVVLTFEDVPPGPLVESSYQYYQKTYGIAFGGMFSVADHSASSWGRPHSGRNVLVSNAEFSYAEFMFKWGRYPALHPSDASSVGGYFSTEPGTVLEMVGYYSSPHEAMMVVGSATIGGPGTETWNNVHVEMAGSPKPINIVDITPVTPDALLHFSIDDLDIEFVPEPSSLAFLALALASVGIGVVRRRR